MSQRNRRYRWTALACAVGMLLCVAVRRPARADEPVLELSPEVMQQAAESIFPQVSDNTELRNQRIDGPDGKVDAWFAKPAGPFELVADRQAVAQGGAVKLAVRATPGYAGVVRMTVYGPDGRAVKMLSRNLDLDNGRASVELPFAFNDTSGDWRIEVSDVLRSLRASTTVKLTESPRPGSTLPPRYNGGVAPAP